MILPPCDVEDVLTKAWRCDVGRSRHQIWGISKSQETLKVCVWWRPCWTGNQEADNDLKGQGPRRSCEWNVAGQPRNRDETLQLEKKKEVLCKFNTG